MTNSSESNHDDSKTTSLWWDDALKQLSQEGLHRKKKEWNVGQEDGSYITATASKDVVSEDAISLHDFASNDYLGMSRDPVVMQAAQNAIEIHGTGARASALICGRTAAHVELEQELCRFEKTEAAILFPTGYAANLGAITALTGKQDILFCDRLNHACLVQGCQLSDAKLQVYHHDQLERLEHHLKKSSSYRCRWILTDGVFSMDGTLAPLPKLCQLAEKYDAKLLVDEAHGTGVFGATGRGAAEHFGVTDRIAVRVGTLSKALGSQGGFVVGDECLIDWLWNCAKTQMFSTALAPANCAAARASLQQIQNAPELIERLQNRSQFARQQFLSHGLSPLGNEKSPIVPILLETPQAAVEVASRLQKSGFLVAAVRPPTVPAGTSRLRITINCRHAEATITQLAKEVATIVSAIKMSSQN